jgi:hypothetical protein
VPGAARALQTGAEVRRPAAARVRRHPPLRRVVVAQSRVACWSLGGLPADDADAADREPGAKAADAAVPPPPPSQPPATAGANVRSSTDDDVSGAGDATSARSGAAGWQPAAVSAASAHDAHTAMAEAALPLQAAGDGGGNSGGGSDTATVGAQRRYKGVLLNKQRDPHKWLVIVHNSVTGQINRGGFFPLDQAEAAARCYDDIVRSLRIKGMPVNFPRDGEAQAQPSVVWRAPGSARKGALRAQKTHNDVASPMPPQRTPPSSSSSLDALAGAVQPPPAQLRAALAALQRSGITAADVLALAAQLSRDDVSDWWSSRQLLQAPPAPPADCTCACARAARLPRRRCPSPPLALVPTRSAWPLAAAPALALALALAALAARRPCRHLRRAPRACACAPPP